jgi:hypothetical protein
MTHEEIYRDWIEVHKRTEVPRDLVENLMREIHRVESAGSERVTVWTRLMERIEASTWMKAAVICAASAIGIGRALLGIHLLFAFRLLGI